MTVRGCGRAVALDVERDAVTAGALTVVGVRVCLLMPVTVVAFWGVPPPLDLVVTLEPRELVERDALELDLLDEPPLELERPLELDELERPLELDELREPPAPADPEPERRANLAAPH